MISIGNSEVIAPSGGQELRTRQAGLFSTVVSLLLGCVNIRWKQHTAGVWWITATRVYVPDQSASNSHGRVVDYLVN